MCILQYRHGKRIKTSQYKTNVCLHTHMHACTYERTHTDTDKLPGVQ